MITKKTAGIVLIGAAVALILLLLDIPYAAGVSEKFQRMVLFVSPGTFLGMLIAVPGACYAVRTMFSLKEKAETQATDTIRTFRAFFLAAIGFSLAASALETLKSGEYWLGTVFWLNWLFGLLGLWIGWQDWFGFSLNRVCFALGQIRPPWFWGTWLIAILVGQIVGASVYLGTPSDWIAMIALNLMNLVFGFIVLLVAGWRYPDSQAIAKIAGRQ